MKELEEFDKLKKQIEDCLRNCDFDGVEDNFRKLMPIARKLVNQNKLTMGNLLFCEDVMDILNFNSSKDGKNLANEEEIAGE